jgi:hypothetical protein
MASGGLLQKAQSPDAFSFRHLVDSSPKRQLEALPTLSAW